MERLDKARRDLNDDWLFEHLVRHEIAKARHANRHNTTGRFIKPPPEDIATREPLFTPAKTAAELINEGNSAPVNLDTTGLKPTDNVSPGDGDAIPDGDLAALLAEYPDALEALAEGDKTKNDSLAERLRQKLQPTEERVNPSDFQKRRPKGESLAERNVRKTRERMVEVFADENVATRLSSAGWYLGSVEKKTARLDSTRDAEEFTGSMADALEVIGWNVRANSDTDSYVYLERAAVVA
jgi:hypothetical protein